MILIIPGNMKKIGSILGVISLFAACTAELDTTPEITEEQTPIIEKAPVLYASIEEGAETKVYLDENYKVLWHADDRISVFNKNTYNQQYRFEGNDGDNAGTFSIVEDGKLHTSNVIDYLYAVYPYRAATSISNSSVLTVNYPAAQTYSADSFGRGANTMVAVTDGENLQFKNACGYLMFKLYGTNVKIKTISLKGNNNEKIAGEATISMSLGDTPTVAMSGSASDEIILNCTDAVTIGSTSEAFTEFWFTLPPVTFTNGFTVTITDNTGKVFQRSTSSSLEIVRSYAKKMAPIEVMTSINPLTFTSTGQSIVSLKKSDSDCPEISLEYKYEDDSWEEYAIGSQIVLEDGERVSFRAGAGGNTKLASSPNYHFHYFFNAGTGTIAASGNVMSLLDSTEEIEAINDFYCFAGLFKWMSSLTSAPALPAMTLGSGCYAHMFEGCTGLRKAPVLPASSLAYECYSYMFSECSSLVEAPALPATSLSGNENCYYSMFRNCTSLKIAPDLPATELSNKCYGWMFVGCENLITAPILPATTLANECYYSMFEGCSSIEVAPDLQATSLKESCYRSMFKDCSSLVSAPSLPAKTTQTHCYEDMFSGCFSLIAAPELPAKTLTESCYSRMFDGCTSLVTPPTLGVKVMADYCYSGMFRGCSSLETPPELPATILSNQCYASMFKGCSSLTSAPELPATTLAFQCYSSMFSGCTSLVSAPELPATTLTEGCYGGMFIDCTSLVTPPELPATTLSNECYSTMFYGCTNLESAPVLLATSLADYCYHRMFYNCTKINYIKALFLTEPSNSYTKNWVFGVASDGVFVKNENATWDVTGANGIPSGWTVQTASD